VSCQRERAAQDLSYGLGRPGRRIQGLFGVFSRFDSDRIRTLESLGHAWFSLPQLMDPSRLCWPGLGVRRL
jgi:hypothetical protein